ncbi:MAG TPA: DUF3892 domain-containing protein [Candidatus Nitrosotalea sp.]|nr:DUF3892 domain-containing protein [Candidatus Nitrosotalea sp.]
MVCKNLTYDGERIQQVGLKQQGETSDRASSAATPAEINQAIRQGHRYFFTNDAGMKVEVDQFGDNFIRTKPDGIVKGNLRHLRDCRFS